MVSSRVVETAEFKGYSVVVSRSGKSLPVAPVLNSNLPFRSDVCSQNQIVYGRPDSSHRVFAGVRESRRRYGNSKKAPIPEVILHKAWRNAGLEHAEVRGRDGHTYRIVYGGKPAGSVGPDFTDAVIERDDGTVFRGDIEIHVRESDWRAHGHHNDARYNGVVLHVVAAESTDSEKRPALKATGVSIPLLALNWKTASPAPSGTDSAVLGHDENRVSAGTTGAGKRDARQPLLLAEAGLERFHAQASGIALDISAFGEDQAIWLGVMGALGYPRNKRAFRALATRVDWDHVSKIEMAQDLERLLIQAAGLEDPTDNNSDGEHGYPRKFVIRGSVPSWIRPWGRPANSPMARIAAISALVPIWSSKGGIALVLRRAVREADRPRDLATLFRPKNLIGDDGVKVVGAARAAEIVVNVLLPGVFAMATFERTGERTGGRTGHGLDVHLKNRAIELFSSHPKLPVNSVTTEAKIALGLSNTVPEVKNARDQQGLIALYRELVRHGIKPRQPRLPGV